MVLQVAKRGRKKKIILNEENIQIKIEEDASTPEDDTAVVVKKRGRKPKGGKLIVRPLEELEKVLVVPNVIIHLKCSLKDLTDYNYKMNELIKDPLMYDPNIPPDIMTYIDTKTSNFSLYEPLQETNHMKDTVTETLDPHTVGSSVPFLKDTCYAYTEPLCKKCILTSNNDTIVDDDDESISIKDVNTKLKRLRIQYFKNSLQDKKSACFWCTYDFDNETCYIPKYDTDDGTICGYGSFCRPECAVAFLMKENIDDSTKFKRYEMLNRIYSKIYDFKKNIKPAADPHYLLEKFYGSLSIKEYRKLSKSEHMLLVLEKPMTRILPELHEDNDEFILNIYGGVKTQQNNGQSGVYKVKRQSEKTQGPTKNSIIQKKFGVAS